MTGERIVFRRTAAETGGESLDYELFFTPPGFVVQEHLHPQQDERHEVIAGRLGLELDGSERVLEPGDVVVVQAGTPHRLFPVGEDQVHARFELRPALRTQELLERFFRLAREGKVSKKGNPSLLELAVIAREFEPEGYATRPPLGVQRALFGPLAALARLLWWRPVYLEAEADGPPEVGRVSRQLFKGSLPYRLRTTSKIVALERPRRIEGTVEGDLSGLGIWTLTPRNSGTHVRFDWHVNADRRCCAT